MNHINRIIFEEPDLAELTQNHTAVDLHFHTRYSDGRNTVKEIAERARELGVGIAVTDHNDIRGAVEIEKYKRILTIPGIEITSREGTHILVYFYNIQSLKKFFKTDIKPFMGKDVMSSTLLAMEEIIQRARAYKTLVVFPHPYCAAYTGINNSYFPQERKNHLFEMVDGVEVINSENLKKWNLQCAVLGFNLNKVITGGSDGHCLAQVGKVVSYTEGKKSRTAFLDAIKQKQNKVIGKEIHILNKVRSNGYKLKTNIKNYPDLVEKNIKYSYTLLNSTSKKWRENVRRRLNGKMRSKFADISGRPAI